MPSRSEKLLAQLLNNPKKPLVIPKNRDLKSTKAMFNERGQVKKEILFALDLMGIKYVAYSMEIHLFE